ncbi:MAG: hypothetical protein OEZ47_15675 [Gammaproteobacteria bacterium]|nr:hypothetical protein [Gammaproteobacteria bacterium]
MIEKDNTELKKLVRSSVSVKEEELNSIAKGAELVPPNKESVTFSSIFRYLGMLIMLMGFSSLSVIIFGIDWINVDLSTRVIFVAALIFSVATLCAGWLVFKDRSIGYYLSFFVLVPTFVGVKTSEIFYSFSHLISVSPQIFYRNEVISVGIKLFLGPEVHIYYGQSNQEFMLSFNLFPLVVFVMLLVIWWTREANN